MFFFLLPILFSKDPTVRFAVNIDGHFLKKPVDELFSKHELLTVPFMTGINDDEGGWLLPTVRMNAKLLQISR